MNSHAHVTLGLAVPPEQPLLRADLGPIARAEEAAGTEEAASPQRGQVSALRLDQKLQIVRCVLHHCVANGRCLRSCGLAHCRGMIYRAELRVESEKTFCS